MVFERIAIVTLGRVGGSIALAARQVWPSALVIGVDHHDVLEAAMRLHAVDVAAEHLSIVSEADLIVLASSSDEQNRGRLDELPAHVDRLAVVTDVARPKVEITHVGLALPGNLTFVGGHPVVGGEGDIREARADLFVGRPWILTPADPARSSLAVARLGAFVAALGALPRVVEAAEYEQVIAGFEV
jgi:prephenate dehydrogenase